MEDIIFKVWPYLERTGAAGSVGLSVLIYFLYKGLQRAHDRADKLQTENTELLKAQIDKAEERTDKMVRTVEQNTVAAAANATAIAANTEVIRAALLRGQP